MSISMALFSPPTSSPLQNSNLIPKISLSLLSTKRISLVSLTRASSDNGTSTPASATVSATTVEAPKPVAVEEVQVKSPSENGTVGGEETDLTTTTTEIKFQDAKWVNGTWDLKQFEKEGKTDWDSVIVAEAKRRKWLEDNPETTSNDEPVLFDTSIIPWWAWMKRYHLPEAELLNGRAAMVGFFMAYFVDSLTGVGLVDQMGNFFCKTLLFVAVAGVLFIRKNEDLDKLKGLIEETTLYDKQWQAAWKEPESSSSSTVSSKKNLHEVVRHKENQGRYPDHSPTIPPRPTGTGRSWRPNGNHVKSAVTGSRTRDGGHLSRGLWRCRRWGHELTVDTEAFERTVVEISKLGGSGGGQFNVPPGRWLTTPFNLTSHMTLFLAEDSEILGVD
ncbi:hypothetical protein Bca101_077251 [Brassica carinata]